MSDNVSEWLDHDYSDYKSFIQTKIEALKMSKFPEVLALGDDMELRTKSFENNYPLIMGLIG